MCNVALFIVFTLLCKLCIETGHYLLFYETYNKYLFISSITFWRSSAIFVVAIFPRELRAFNFVTQLGWVLAYVLLWHLSRLHKCSRERCWVNLPLPTIRMNCVSLYRQIEMNRPFPISSATWRTNPNGATWWPNLELMQMAPSVTMKNNEKDEIWRKMK